MGPRAEPLRLRWRARWGRGRTKWDEDESALPLCVAMLVPVESVSHAV